MAILSKKQILDAPDLKIETVPVPEWGGDVLVRGLTGEQRDTFEASIVHLEGKKAATDLANIRAKLVSASLVDEKGDLLFDERDVEALGRKSAVALQRIFEVAQRLSGLTQSDVEELAKNSGSALGGASTSA
jgi:hypothetical protein